MKKLYIVAGIGAALAAAPAMASPDLAAKLGCTACHGIDARLPTNFPSYKEVAAKYRGNPKAEAMLSERVIKGSVPGAPLVWGAVPMPPKGGNPANKDADIKTLVKWILSLPNPAPAKAAPKK